jgi:hypothetical protein
MTIAAEHGSATGATRLLWGLGLCGALAVLVVARALAPDPSLVGTHVQLGLPPCAFLAWTGVPCPTCGLTTAFAHMARLEITMAARAHWLGPLLFALNVAALPLCAFACVRALPFAQVIKRLRLARVAAIIAAAATVGWFARLSVMLFA